MSGMDRLTELLPCPFCGGKATLLDIGDLRGEYQAGCDDGSCGISAYAYSKEPKEAIAAWNRRASQAAPAPADGLREAVPLGLVEALRSGRQADMDGVMVTVSRQACEMAADILSALTRAKVEAASVACPCTYIEQDESCPVGYPSLLCGICNGDGSTRQEKVTQLAAEMIRIASDLGEPEDPFAAWESVAALRERAEEAEAERDRQYDENVHRIAMQARAENERDAARRAEAAAWNDAIEAAAGEVESLWAFRTSREVTDAICALRRATPTEGEA